MNALTLSSGRDQLQFEIGMLIQDQDNHRALSDAIATLNPARLGSALAYIEGVRANNRQIVYTTLQDFILENEVLA